MKVWMASLALWGSLSAYSAPFVAPPPAQEVPSNFQSGGQYYDSSVSGLSKYMVDLSMEDKKAHAALVGDLETLESKRLWSTVVPIGLFVGGLGLELAAIGSGSSSVLAFSGVLLVLAAVPTYYFMRPDRSDYLDFINKHNRLRPTKPLKLNIGMHSEAPVTIAQWGFSF